jgi:hypothetical protein
MRALSGIFLSRLLELLGRTNREKFDDDRFVLELLSMVKAGDVWCDVGEGTRNAISTIDPSVVINMRAITGAPLATLNSMLPWSSYNQITESEILGGVYKAGKRSAAHKVPDPHIRVIQSICGLGTGFTALEVGCFEGHYTSSLAALCKTVYALDSRIENVVKTIVRCWVFGLEKKVSVDLLNLEELSVSDFYKNRYGVDSVDLIHHRGVLYHLSDPVTHLQELTRFCGKYLYLHTQYADTEQPLTIQNTIFGQYRFYSYKEKSVEQSPFAGMVSEALWMQKEDLFDVLRKCGFTEFRILNDKIERNGPRIELLAAKSGAVLK